MFLKASFQFVPEIRNLTLQFVYSSVDNGIYSLRVTSCLHCLVKVSLVVVCKRITNVGCEFRLMCGELISNALAWIVTDAVASERNLDA